MFPQAAHLDLWDAAWCWGDAHQIELAQHLVVGSHLALTLEHLDADLRVRKRSSQVTQLKR
jgi:hypothetical protein